MIRPMKSIRTLWPRRSECVHTDKKASLKGAQRAVQALGNGRNSEGFTLAEVLAALAVMGVATFLFLRLFSTSLDITVASRSLKVATEIAENHLLELTQYPKMDDPSQLAAGALVPLTALSECPPPAVLPLDASAREREKNFYSKFSWEGYVRLPDEQAAYVEVIVAVRWFARGRDQVLTLTSCLPRTALEKTS